MNNSIVPFPVARSLFPADRVITAGQKLSIEFAGGISRVMLVTGVSETGVTLDGNHPLSGCDLTFALKVDTIN